MYVIRHTSVYIYTLVHMLRAARKGVAWALQEPHIQIQPLSHLDSSYSRLRAPPKFSDVSSGVPELESLLHHRNSQCSNVVSLHKSMTPYPHHPPLAALSAGSPCPGGWQVRQQVMASAIASCSLRPRLGLWSMGGIGHTSRGFHGVRPCMSCLGWQALVRSICRFGGARLSLLPLFLLCEEIKELCSSQESWNHAHWRLGSESEGKGLENGSLEFMVPTWDDAVRSSRKD